MKITQLYMASSAVASCGFLPTGGLQNLSLKLKSGDSRHPQILPDGKSVLFTSSSNSSQ